MQSDELLEMLRTANVLPIVSVNNAAIAVPLARALHRGGLKAIEIVLRTPVALEAIAVVSEQVPELVVGVGTVRTPADLEAAADAGATFAVSPGLTRPLMERGCEFCLVPGVATASEAMMAAEEGYRFLKLFPAESCGGVGLLKSLVGPLPDLLFCPTGGVDGASAPGYLALPNVVCVGGSWLVPAHLLETRDWNGLERHVRNCLASLHDRSEPSPLG